MHVLALVFEFDAVSVAQAAANTLMVSIEDSFKVVIGAGNGVKVQVLSSASLWIVQLQALERSGA